MTFQERREALYFALKDGYPKESPKSIIDRATVFYNFLVMDNNGEDSRKCSKSVDGVPESTPTERG